jgi:hypothetical protein
MEGTQTHGPIEPFSICVAILTTLFKNNNRLTH